MKAFDIFKKTMIFVWMRLGINLAVSAGVILWTIMWIAIASASENGFMIILAGPIVSTKAIKQTASIRVVTVALETRITAYNANTTGMKKSEYKILTSISFQNFLKKISKNLSIPFFFGAFFGIPTPVLLLPNNFYTP